MQGLLKKPSGPDLSLKFPMYGAEKTSHEHHTALVQKKMVRLCRHLGRPSIKFHLYQASVKQHQEQGEEEALRRGVSYERQNTAERLTSAAICWLHLVDR